MALFLYSVGPDAVKIYNSFDLSDENRRKLSEIIKEFDKFAIGETNETYERYVFNSRDQKEGESIDDYVGELRTLAQTCNFCTCLHDTLETLRSRFGYLTANGKPRFAVSGFTLAVCPYLELKIHGYFLRNFWSSCQFFSMSLANLSRHSRPFRSTLLLSELKTSLRTVAISSQFRCVRGFLEAASLARARSFCMLGHLNRAIYRKQSIHSCIYISSEVGFYFTLFIVV